MTRYGPHTDPSRIPGPGDESPPDDPPECPECGGIILYHAGGMFCIEDDCEWGVEYDTPNEEPPDDGAFDDHGPGYEPCTGEE